VGINHECYEAAKILKGKQNEFHLWCLSDAPGDGENGVKGVELQG